MCRPLKGFDEFMALRFGEFKVGLGDQGAGYFAVYVNPDTKTWSLIVLNTSEACMVASGKDWRPVPLPQVA